MTSISELLLRKKLGDTSVADLDVTDPLRDGLKQEFESETKVHQRKARKNPSSYHRRLANLFAQYAKTVDNCSPALIQQHAALLTGWDLAPSAWWQRKVEYIDLERPPLTAEELIQMFISATSGRA